jgi:hypothetical protein
MDPVSGQPEILPYPVRVMAFFPEGQRAPGKYWTFEYLIFLQANSPSAASKRALSLLRSILDSPERLEKLGTREKPEFYAVVGDCPVELPDGAAVPFEHPMIINYLTLEQQDVQALKTHAQARFPVRRGYLEECS